VDYAFLIPSSSRLRVQHIKNYVEAAKRNSVRYLVLLSILRPDERATRFGNEFRDMEEWVEQASPDIKYSFIRTSILDQTLFLFAQGTTIHIVKVIRF
jgi:delta-aminolevulinic acid dehydratase/porphobilinogen synthase